MKEKNLFLLRIFNPVLKALHIFSNIYNRIYAFWENISYHLGLLLTYFRWFFVTDFAVGISILSLAVEKSLIRQFSTVYHLLISSNFHHKNRVLRIRKAFAHIFAFLFIGIMTYSSSILLLNSRLSKNIGENWNSIMVAREINSSQKEYIEEMEHQLEYLQEKLNELKSLEDHLKTISGYESSN